MLRSETVGHTDAFSCQWAVPAASRAAHSDCALLASALSVSVFLSFSHILPVLEPLLSSPPLPSLPDMAGPLIALNMVTILFKLILG